MTLGQLEAVIALADDTLRRAGFLSRRGVCVCGANSKPPTVNAPSWTVSHRDHCPLIQAAALRGWASTEHRRLKAGA